MTRGTEAAARGPRPSSSSTSASPTRRKRVGFDQSRPLLAVNPRASWVRLMNERRPVYERVATVRVDTAGRTPAGRRGRGRRACSGRAVSAPTARAAPAPPSSRSATPTTSSSGTGVLDRVAGLLGAGVRAGARRPPADAGRARRRGGRRSLRGAGLRRARRRGARRRGGQDRRGRGRPLGACWARPASPAPTPSSAVGGGTVTDLAGFVAATWLRGVARRPGADDPARHGRRGRRRQDRHQHRRGQEPRRARSTRRPGCSATSTCSRRCRGPTSWPGWPRWSSAGFIADPVILDLVEADPAAADPVRTAPHTARARRAGDPGQGRRRRRRTCASRGCARSSTTGTPSGTPSSRSSATVAARRGGRASAWSTPPSSRRAGRAPRPTARRGAAPVGARRRSGCRRRTRRAAGTQLLAAMRRDKKSRGDLLRFVVLDGIGAAGAARGPRRGLAARRVHRHLHLTPRNAHEVHRPSVLRAGAGRPHA